MERNHQVMLEIEEMVKEQGGNIDQIEVNLQSAYGKITDANVELTEAQKIQNQTRLMKIKLGVTGIFAALGLKFLGIPGMIAGFFGGLVTVMK